MHNTIYIFICIYIYDIYDIYYIYTPLKSNLTSTWFGAGNGSDCRVSGTQGARNDQKTKCKACHVLDGREQCRSLPRSSA